MSVAASLGARVLADPTDVGSETLKAGPVAILIIAVLCIGCFFLFRSMSKHLRHVRDEFPVDGPSDRPGDAGAADTDPTAASGTSAAPPPRAAATPPAPGSVRAAPKSRTGADHPTGR